MNIPPLKLAKLPYPHIPLGVLSTRDIPSKTASSVAFFAEKSGLKILERDNCIIILDESSLMGAKDVCFFTGVAYVEDKLVFGEKARPASDSLEERYGEFSYFDFSGDLIKFGTDVFGFGKWYYYNYEGDFAAATSYHLLLQLLAAAKIPLEMDIQRSRVNLFEIGGAFSFGQQFSRRMDVKHTYVTIPTEKLSFDQAGRRTTLTPSPLYSLVTDPTEYDEDSYEKAILHAKEEISNNLRAVMESPEFDRVVIDLSGGFDSRVVYATMTTMPKRLRDKASVFIRQSHLSDDQQIGNSVNNLYGHEVVAINDLDTSEIFNQGEIDLFNVSLELGGYSNLETLRKCNINPKYVQITGGGGDILFGFYRVYGDYAKTLPSNSEDDKVIEKIAYNSATPISKKCPGVIDDAKEILKENFEGYPEHLHLFQKLQVFYLLYRNNTHFSAIKYQNSLLTLTVLQSKSALRAKWIYWSKFGRNDIPPEKVSVDMINAINPLLGKIPFATENDSRLPASSDLLQPATLKINPDLTIKPYRHMSDRPSEKTYSAKAREYLRDLSHANDLLDLIDAYSPAYCEVTKSLRDLLTMSSSDFSKGFPFRTVNKIFHLGYEISIVNSTRLFSQG